MADLFGTSDDSDDEAPPSVAPSSSSVPGAGRSRWRARDEMGPDLPWSFAKELASGRANCFICGHKCAGRTTAVKLVADNPLVTFAGQAKWMHLDCTLGRCFEPADAPGPVGANKKRKRATGVASGSVKCKLCKQLLAPDQAYCRMFDIARIKLVPASQRRQYSNICLHAACADAVKDALLQQESD
jgi:hypothetical protein